MFVLRLKMFHKFKSTFDLKSIREVSVPPPAFLRDGHKFIVFGLITYSFLPQVGIPIFGVNQLLRPTQSSWNSGCDWCYSTILDCLPHEHISPGDRYSITATESLSSKKISNTPAISVAELNSNISFGFAEITGYKTAWTHVLSACQWNSKVCPSPGSSPSTYFVCCISLTEIVHI